MEIYTTDVAAAQMGAAFPGAGSPWANLAAGVNQPPGSIRRRGVNHARAPYPVLATGWPDARLGAFRPDSAPMSPVR